MDTICKEDLCTGCSACRNVCHSGAITLRENERGFPYPEVDMNKCIDCGMCRDVCPVNHPPRANSHAAVYAAFDKKEENRLKSSSGGVFSRLAEQTLTGGGSVFGAILDETLTVRHFEAHNRETLDQMRGSKYVQSDMGLCYQTVKARLDEGKKVLFSGTPCQVAGLRNYLGADYPNLLLIDILCHGVPSPGLFRQYIKSEESIAGSKMESMLFRAKRIGWKNFYTVRRFDNGREATWADTFVPGFLQNLYLRESCYSCQYATDRRQGDITLGDYWGYCESAPDYIEDDDKGISLVIINNKKGEDAFESIRKQLIVTKRSMEDAKRGNPVLYTPCAKGADYDAFWRDEKQMSWDKLKEKYLEEQDTTDRMSPEQKAYFAIPYGKRHFQHKIRRKLGRVYRALLRALPFNK